MPIAVYVYWGAVQETEASPRAGDEAGGNCAGIVCAGIGICAGIARDT
jgi:hypothetical protein